MKKLLPALVLVLADLAAGCGGGDDEATVGIMATITGDAGSIGREQLNRAKLAVESVLGELAFDETGDPRWTQFYVSQIEGGEHSLVTD